MIERLKGQLVATVPGGVIIDVAGVGYGVEMPLSALCTLPPVGETVQVWTYTHVREDAIKLYGFATYAERATFEILLSLSGVGPKVGIAILSTLSLQQIQNAIIRHEATVFETVPGVGGRLSERILLELKPKLKRLQGAARIDGASTSTKAGVATGLFADDATGSENVDNMFDDVKSALENLGFAEKNVNNALKKLRTDNSLTEFQALMRRALLELTGSVGRTETPTTAVNRELPGF